MAGGRLNRRSDVACGQAPRSARFVALQTSLSQLFFVPACGFSQRSSAYRDGICRLMRQIVGKVRRRIR